MSVQEWVAGLLSPSGWWSLGTMLVSIGGIWLGGYEPRWGWWWGIPTQVVWFTAGVFTQRPGDMVLSVVFTLIYIRNLRRNRGASYRNQRGAAELRTENAQLRAELAECRGEPATAGVR